MGKVRRRADSGWKFTEASIIVLLFLFIFATYLSLLSRYYVFDSILDAANVENHNDMFDSRHIIQHLIMRLFYLGWVSLGYTQGAIVPIEVLNALFAALGVAVFLMLVKKIVGDDRVAILSSLLLAFSWGYFRYSGECETMIMPCLPLVGALYLILPHGKRRPNYLLAGVLYAIEVLLYQLHLVFAPAFLFAILAGNGPIRERIKGAATFLICATFLITAVYLGIGLLVLSVPTNGLIVWFLGPSQHSVWTGYNSLSAGRALTALHTVVLGYWPYPKLAQVFWALFVPLLAYSAVYRMRIWKAYGRLTIVCIFFIVSFMPFQLYYNPENNQQVVPLLMPFWLLAAMVYKDMRQRGHMVFRALPYAILILLFSINFFGTVYPFHLAENNRHTAKSAFLKDFTKQGDLIIVNGFGDSALDRMYIPYFAKRDMTSIWDLFCCVEGSKGSLQTLKGMIDAHMQNGGRVYIFGDVFDPTVKFERLVNFVSPINGYEVNASLSLDYTFEYRTTFDDEKLYEIVRRG